MLVVLHSSPHAAVRHVLFPQIALAHVLYVLTPHVESSHSLYDSIPHSECAHDLYSSTPQLECLPQVLTLNVLDVDDELPALSVHECVFDVPVVGEPTLDEPVCDATPLKLSLQLV